MVLTSEEISALTGEIRSALPDLSQEMSSDAELRRWAVAWDGRLGDILPRLENTLRIRQALRLDDVPLLPFKEDPLGAIAAMEEYCGRAYAPGAFRLFPGGFAGLDRAGNVVAVELLGRIRPKDLLSSAKCSDVIACRILENEFYRRLLNDQTEKLGRQAGIMLIYDFYGLSWENADFNLFHIYVDILRLMQEMFPEFCCRVYFVRAPSVVQIGYSIAKTVLSKRTADKVVMLGKDWKEQLLKEISPDQLPVEWGGTRVGNDGSPFGPVRPGGQVDNPGLLYRAKDNPREPANSGLPLQSISVGRGSVHVETRRLDSPGILTWFFRVGSGDLYFWVEAVGEEGKSRLVQPRFRLNTDNAPEWGSVDAPPGTYTLHFDNTHSYLKAKALQYYVAVEEA